MENFEHILLFKTNIRTPRDKAAVEVLFNANESIEQWNIDQEDEDCVLRVVSCALKHSCVERLVRGSGYECTELT